MISRANYSRTITVDATIEDAYRALTLGFEHWWTQADQLIEHVGDKVTFTFLPDKTSWTFEVTTMVPLQEVCMRCIKAFHSVDGMPNAIEQEWLGTRLIWKIEARGEQTNIKFEHLGLEPGLNCYDICEQGWDHFFVDSLKTYLDTGVGNPH